LETITKTTVLMMAAGLLIAAPACGEQFAKSMTVSAPEVPQRFSDPACFATTRPGSQTPDSQKESDR
jgi:hypothetical protein